MRKSRALELGSAAVLFLTVIAAGGVLAHRQVQTRELRRALDRRDMDRVRSLVTSGADVHTRSEGLRQTALHLAALYGEPALVE